LEEGKEGEGGGGKTHAHVLCPKVSVHNKQWQLPLCTRGRLKACLLMM